MIATGFVLFYSIENTPNLDQSSQYAKHGGTFVGLMGIGVTIAGILLRLMGREQLPVQEGLGT